MAEFVHEDVVERILIELDVKDLIRYKSVCKSWHSLITSSRFVNRHLNHSYNKDRVNNKLCNYKLGDRRIKLAYESPDINHLVGSSNGLVCIFSAVISSEVAERKYKVIVGNPSTREVRQLKLPPRIELSELCCWGFGYDSFVDDYKVVVGVSNGWNQTCFQMLSLKSNVWKVTGEVKYRFISKVGILCNDALHWIVKDQYNKNLIICYDLSKEEVIEFPQPDEASRYECTSYSGLGIVKECLCIYCEYCPGANIWLLKNYNVKQSWELVSCSDELNCDMLHFLNASFFHDVVSWVPDILEDHRFSWIWHNFDAPTFVQSLVSPYVNGSYLTRGDSGPNA